MSNRLLFGLVAIVAFAAAICGVVVGRVYFIQPQPVESELHSLLHEELDLNRKQKSEIAEIERRFAIRKQALELELRSDNARLADAIEIEHGYGPKVNAAVDRSHEAMGELQKVTLEHIFAMREVLRPDQAGKFDEALVKALTAQER